VRVERRPVHCLVAGETRPGGVSAAVTEASLITHDRPAGAELVPVRAARGRADDPRARRGLYEVADSRTTDVVIPTIAAHNRKRKTVDGEKLHT
jgi:hypothetical protein